MTPGYDAGLYHLPYQLILREEKIVFGLSNLHDRYGLTSMYSYLSAPLWVNSKFNLVAHLQSIFYQIFFLYVFYLIKSKKLIYKIIALNSLIFFFLWFRYNEISFGLTDLPYGIVFYFSICAGIMTLLSVQKEIIRDNVFLLLVFTLFAYTLKSNGIVLFIYVALILLYLLVLKKIQFNEIFYLSLLIAIPFLLWTLRNFIITGCLVFPIAFTCMPVEWGSHYYVANTMNAISGWALRSFEFYNFNYFFNLFIYLFIFVVFSYLLIKKYKLFILRILHKIKFLYFFFFILNLLFFFHIFNLQDLKGFSQLVTEKKISLVKNIMFFEITTIITFFLYSFTFSLILIKKYKSFIFNFKLIIPTIFCLLYFLIWFFIAPNPRFAIGFFAVLGFVFIIPFIKLVEINSKKFDYSLKIFFVLTIMKISFVYPINNSDFKNKDLYVPKAEVVRRGDFGFIPKDLKNDNKCWINLNCFTQINPVEKNKILFEYYLVKIKR